MPLKYNHHQHTIADEYRGEYNLSTNVYRKTRDGGSGSERGPAPATAAPRRQRG